MADEERPTTRFEAEIEEIEDRAATRRSFWIVGAVAAVILLGIVIMGGRERMRLRAEAARPRAEAITLGRHLGTVSNQAVFARENGLVYLEGVGDAEIGPTTTFARELEYDLQGNPIPLTGEILYWKLASSDSLPYIVEPLPNPLIGVNPAQYRVIQLGALRPQDYSVGGPHDWRPYEEDRVAIQVTGLASREDGALILTDGPSRVRIQGVEALGAIDSLEVVWATENQASLTAFGRIATTPRTGDVLFVMTAEGVHPPEPETAADQRGDTTAAGADTAPAPPGQAETP